MFARKSRTKTVYVSGVVIFLEDATVCQNMYIHASENVAAKDLSEEHGNSAECIKEMMVVF